MGVKIKLEISLIDYRPIAAFESLIIIYCESIKKL